MGDNFAGAVILLALAVIIVPILIVFWIVQAIADNWDEISAALIATAKGIWQGHQYVGYGLLWLVRDLPVRLVPTETWPDEKIRTTIILWLTAAPLLLLGTIGVLLTVLYAALFSSWLIALLIALPSVTGIGIGYYKNYFERPVWHHRWPRFMAQFYLLQAEGKLSYVEKTTELRFWIAQKKSSVHEPAAQNEQ